MTENEINQLKQLAEQGDVEAQFNLGGLYHQGLGVEQSDSKAAEWYGKAAEQGHVKAQFNLGVCYDQGLGVEQSDSKAAEWYEKAAEQGHVKAQFNLGLCYDQGLGVEQSDSKAAEWYGKAAEQGDVDAQFNLGVCYGQGLGVEQSDSKAAEWYGKAAEQGDVDAQFNLGVRYHQGLGVEQSDSKAAEWYEKAAEQGHVKAQFNLGVCYDQGLGVEQSDSKAAEWYGKAAEQNNTSVNNAFESMIHKDIFMLLQYEEDKQLNRFINIAEKYQNIFDKLNVTSKFILKQILDIYAVIAVIKDKKQTKVKANIIALWGLIYQIIDTLHIKFLDNNEQKVAHYINKNWAFSLLEGKQALRLIPLQFMNDPTEGKLLTDILNNRIAANVTHREQEDFCFIKSFSFNFNSLNQFRLYGKSDNIEASGLSLVFKQDYFLKQVKNYRFSEVLISQPESKDVDAKSMGEKQEKSELPESKHSESDGNKILKPKLGKLPLYRCIYLEPESLCETSTEKWIIGVSHTDQSSFMLGTGKTSVEYQSYLNVINAITANITQHFEKLFTCYGKLMKSLKSVGANSEEKIKILKVVDDIILPLSFLIKHYAFKEEQECRCFYVSPLNAEVVQTEKDKEHVFVEMENIIDELQEIYLGIKAADSKVYIEKVIQDNFKLEDKPKVYISNHPFK
ncbi:tetratricopeptide repeat protein [Neisseria sp. 74A18]|uniref:tetratricopeptide repeat protein n=1 Tax=Neisseria sp. 74A18 TaxID=1696094 RepID=UPI0006CAD47B|nr:tetratricopeptide repeat protein [Neisseria sp. 74A18]